MYTKVFEMYDVAKAKVAGLMLAAMVALAGGAEAATLADCVGGFKMTAPGVVTCAGVTPPLLSCAGSAGDTTIDSKGVVRCSATTSTATPSCTLKTSAGYVQGAYTLTATCTPAAASYTWSYTGCSSTSATCTVAPTVTTSYTVAGKNSAGVAGNTATMQVTVGGTPAPTGRPVCTLSAIAGFSVGQILVQASCNPAATSYTWSANTGFSSTVSSGSIATPSTTTTFTVIGHNASGSSALASAIYSVSVPTCTLTPASSSIAPNGASLLTANCTPAATSYTWTGGNCAGIAANTCNATLATGSQPYTVQGSNVAGAGNIASATVTVAAPTCTVTPASSSIAPDGHSILTANCSPAATSYLWTLLTGTGTCDGTTNSTCDVTLSTGSVTYKVTGTNGAGTGSASNTATVTVAPPTCTLTANPTSIAPNGTSTLTASCPTADSYIWTGGTCVGSTTSCIVTLAASQAYTVRGHNAAGDGNTASTTVTVIVPGARVNTNIPITFGTDFGKNFNLPMSRNQSVSVQFTTPPTDWPTGSVIKEYGSQGSLVATFANISAIQSDFTYPNFAAWNGCGNFGLVIALRYKVESVDSHTYGYCSLRPNTTYYFNIRNESSSASGLDTCASGASCGFLFQMH